MFLQADKSASQQADKLESQEVSSPVLEQEAIVITTVQADKSSSQQSDKIASQKVRKSESQQYANQRFNSVKKS